jgi:hypothetical protein
MFGGQRYWLIKAYCSAMSNEKLIDFLIPAGSIVESRNDIDEKV